jgi:hypothetical protein
LLAGTGKGFRYNGAQLIHARSRIFGLWIGWYWIMSSMVNTLKFRKEYLNSKLVPPDRTLEDAFTSFVLDSLKAEYPGLVSFPTNGKDGCIDLVQRPPDFKRVFECKQIGEDGKEPAERRWKEVEKLLAKNIVDPSGPPKGQSQYRPWYNTKQPIREYIFCISSTLANEAQVEGLTNKISEFFEGLSAQYAHLAHLSGMAVKVLHWQDFCSRLNSDRYLLFCWFPKLLPQGWEILGSNGSSFTKREPYGSYLGAKALKHYSISEYVAKNDIPSNLSALTESKSLSLLTSGRISGIIITGGIGSGLTRAMLELGRLALRRKRQVITVDHPKAEDLKNFSTYKNILQKTTILLFDNVEEYQEDFAEFVKSLNFLNSEYDLKISYIATCLNTYYEDFQRLDKHKRINLSSKSNEQSWLSGYQEQLAYRISSSHSMRAKDRYLNPSSRTSGSIDVLIGNPAFTTFCLDSHKRSISISDLHNEERFVKWVYKSIDRIFSKDKDCQNHLFHYFVLGPLQDHSLKKLWGYNSQYETSYSLLTSSDFFQSSKESFQKWWVIHRAIADTYLLNQLAEKDNLIIKRAFSRVIELAVEIDCLSSTITRMEEFYEILRQRNPEAASELEKVLLEAKSRIRYRVSEFASFTRKVSESATKFSTPIAASIVGIIGSITTLLFPSSAYGSPSPYRQEEHIFGQEISELTMLPGTIKDKNVRSEFEELSSLYERKLIVMSELKMAVGKGVPEKELEEANQELEQIKQKIQELEHQITIKLASQTNNGDPH